MGPGTGWLSQQRLYWVSSLSIDLRDSTKYGLSLLSPLTSRNPLSGFPYNSQYGVFMFS